MSAAYLTINPADWFPAHFFYIGASCSMRHLTVSLKTPPQSTNQLDCKCSCKADPCSPQNCTSIPTQHQIRWPFIRAAIIILRSCKQALVATHQRLNIKRNMDPRESEACEIRISTLIHHRGITWHNWNTFDLVCDGQSMSIHVNPCQSSWQAKQNLQSSWWLGSSLQPGKSLAAMTTIKFSSIQNGCVMEPVQQPRGTVEC